MASGLQRVGRAAITSARLPWGLLPDHRSDLIASAVVVERMRHGAIEEVAELRNPLDVLAQQIVAIVSIEDAKAEELYALVRKAAASAACPTARLRRCSKAPSGRYPSEEFAGAQAAPDLAPRHRCAHCPPRSPALR